MSGWFTHAKFLIGDQSLDLAISNVLYCALLGETTDLLAHIDAATVDDITTLGEFDGVGYSRKVVPSVVTSEDSVNRRCKFDCGDIDFGDLANGTNRIRYALIYKGTINPANDNTNIPVCYITRPEGPTDPDGGNVTVAISSQGLAYF